MGQFHLGRATGLMEEKESSTLLDPDEKEGLIPGVQTQEELNEWEQSNILEAERWLFPTRRSWDRILTSPFLKVVHERMFDHVWEWAGQFRTSEKNLGIDPRKISVECRKLFDDATYWLEEETFDELEYCARVHHRLTRIHPFPNGNGRHARMYVDYLSHCLGRSRFSWGGSDQMGDGNTREDYIQSLRDADGGDIKSLIDFMKS